MANPNKPVPPKKTPPKAKPVREGLRHAYHAVSARRRPK
jgi:hypothetical protein